MWYRMPIFSFIGHFLPELSGKTDKWRQICKQTGDTFYTSNDVCLKNKVLRRKNVQLRTWYESKFGDINVHSFFCWDVILPRSWTSYINNGSSKETKNYLPFNPCTCITVAKIWFFKSQLNELSIKVFCFCAHSPSKIHWLYFLFFWFSTVFIVVASDWFR